MVHDDFADGQHKGSATDNNERIGEKLRTGEMFNIVPSPMKRSENVDKQQGEKEHKYQVEGDIVLRKVIFGYLLVHHSPVKISLQKYVFFRYAIFATCDFVPEITFSSHGRIFNPSKVVDNHNFNSF